MPGDKNVRNENSHSIVSTASELGMNVPEMLHGRYREDAYFYKVVNNISNSPHFQYTHGMLYRMQDGVYLL